MHLPVLAMLLLMAPPPPSESQRDWIQTDIRLLEFAPPPANQPSPCARLWIEERTWSLLNTPAGLIGVYGNNVRTLPLGTTQQSCRFASQPATPGAFSVRTWRIASATRDGSAWNVRAEPIGATGDQLGLKHDPFSTRLWEIGEFLVDSSSSPSDANRLEFRRPGPLPGDLQPFIKTTLEGLNSGECARIMSSVVDPRQPQDQNAAAVAAICDIRRRMVAIAGGFLSVSIGDITRVDRVAAAIIETRDAQGWYTQPTYLVRFTTNYERQNIPGDALFSMDGGRWRLARLWF